MGNHEVWVVRGLYDSMIRTNANGAQLMLGGVAITPIFHYPADTETTPNQYGNEMPAQDFAHFITDLIGEYNNGQIYASCSYWQMASF